MLVFSKIPQWLWIVIALIAACITCWLDIPLLLKTADVIAGVFVDLLRLISLPVVFLSVLATMSGLENLREFRSLGGNVIFYTIFTTIISILIGLCIYQMVSPADVSIGSIVSDEESFMVGKAHYGEYLRGLIPSNFIKTFLDNNVIGVIIIAFLIGGGVILLDDSRKRIMLHDMFQALFDTIVKIASGLMKFIPLVVWAFVTVSIQKMDGSGMIKTFAWFALAVFLANTVHAFIFLPTLLLSKGLKPIFLFKKALPALSMAFFTSSSSAALPTTLKCSIKDIGLSNKVASFSLPICATINMNGCAAFILMSLLFVFECNGYVVGITDIMTWIFLAMAGAIGNAGVPMGCYFMASTMLVALGMPLDIMVVWLPMHRILDMYETALNVWSDVCVTSIISKKSEGKNEGAMLSE